MANPNPEPQEGLRARKKRALRRNILARAAERFSARGSADTRIEEIAADLEVSAATVFNYFGSKDAILLEIAKDLIADLERALDPRSDASLEDRSKTESSKSNSTAQDWSIAMERLERAFNARPSMNRRLCGELMRVTLPHEVGREIVSRIHRALTRRIEQGQQRGEIRADYPSETLAELVADMLTGAFNNWLNDAGRPLSDRMGQAADFMREALLDPVR